MRRNPDAGREDWAAGVVVFLFATALILLILLLLRVDRERMPLVERVPERDVAAFESRVLASLTPVAVRPADRLRVRATRVAWLDDVGQPWVESPRVTFFIRPAAVGTVVTIEDGLLEAPRLRLVQRATGAWNYDPVLAPLLEREPPARPDLATEVRLRNIRARGGDVTLVRPEAIFRATDVSGVLASGVLTGPGVAEPSFHVSRAEGVLAVPGPDETTVSRQVTLEDGRFRLPDGAVAFDVARFTFASSAAVGVVGVWDPAFGGLALDARATVERLALEDVPWLRAEAPEDAVATGHVVIQPLPGDRSRLALTDLTVRSETSAAAGSVTVVIGPEAQLALESVDLLLDPLALSLVEAFTGPLPYVGELRGTVRGTAADLAFDLRASLGVAPGAVRFTIDVEGRGALVDLEFQLFRLAADLHDVPAEALEPLAPGLPFRGVVTGTVILEGAPGDVPLTLDLRLETGGGIVTAAGTLDLRGAELAYDVSGRVIAVDLRRVLTPPLPPVLLHATFGLAGTGVSPATADATLRVDGRFTGWRAEPGDTLALDVRLAQGLLMARQARLDVGPVHVQADGEWRVALGEGGAIRYRLVVESLEPLAPYLPALNAQPLLARGALEAEGFLSGTLDAPTLSGVGRAVDFRYDGWAAALLDARYEARLGPALPWVQAEARGTHLRTPGGDFDAATVAFELTPPAFDIRVLADRVAGQGMIQFEAGGSIDEDGIGEVVLRALELDLEGERWRLTAPARIAREVGDVVVVSDLRIEQVDADGLVRLDGVIAPGELSDLAIDLVALPVGDLLGLVRADLDVAGRLWLRGTLTGSADDPVIEAEAQLLEGMVRNVPVQHVQARIQFQDQRLTVTADGLLEEAAGFELHASLPLTLTLGLPPTAELIAEAPIQAQLRAQDFALAVLGPALPAVRDLEGLLTADILLGGTPMDPALSGGAALRDGAVTVRLLNQRYTGIEGEATLAGEILSIDRFIARSDGTAALTGQVRFADLTNPILGLTAEFQRFRAQRVRGRRDAALSGRLAIGGTPLSPVLAGRLVVEDGTLDMTQLQPPGRLSEDLMGIADRFDPLGPPQPELLDPVATGVVISRLDLSIGTDVWFQADEFRILLGGDLVIEKPADDVMIVGTLSGDRGTFNMRMGPATRRFDIRSATLQFFGSPGPDPVLDITAARIIPGPQRTDFELQIRLTGTLSAPAIAFATEDGTAIPEAEALNFLVFGRASATLADFPGAGFGTTQSWWDVFAFGGGFDWVAAALAEQFGAGIDYFQILARTDVGEMGPELAFVLGHEVIDDVFVLVTLPTTEFEARWAASAEWRIDRQWTLEAGYEPPDLVLASPGRRLPFAIERQQQIFLSIRRHWTY